MLLTNKMIHRHVCVLPAQKVYSGDVLDLNSVGTGYRYSGLMWFCSLSQREWIIWVKWATRFQILLY